jgi:hypothetical protein
VAVLCGGPVGGRAPESLLQDAGYNARFLGYCAIDNPTLNGSVESTSCFLGLQLIAMKLANNPLLRGALLPPSPCEQREPATTVEGQCARAAAAASPGEIIRFGVSRPVRGARNRRSGDSISASSLCVELDDARRDLRYDGLP